MAEFEAELAEQEAEAGGEGAVEEDKAKSVNEEAWLKSDRDYTYEEVSYSAILGFSFRKQHY